MISVKIKEWIGKGKKKVMSKQRLFLFAGLILLAGVLGGCAGDASLAKQNIFDDEAALVQEADSYTYANRLGGGESQDQLDLEYSGFSGMETIWTFEVEDAGQLSLAFDSSVESGDFKVVLITPDKEIEEVLNGEQQGETTLALGQGTTILRLVGRDAGGHIVLSITQNQGVTIRNIR